MAKLLLLLTSFTTITNAAFDSVYNPKKGKYFIDFTVFQNYSKGHIFIGKIQIYIKITNVVLAIFGTKIFDEFCGFDGFCFD